MHTLHNRCMHVSRADASFKIVDHNNMHTKTVGHRKSGRSQVQNTGGQPGILRRALPYHHAMMLTCLKRSTVLTLQVPKPPPHSTYVRALLLQPARSATASRTRRLSSLCHAHAHRHQLCVLVSACCGFRHSRGPEPNCTNPP